MSRNVLIEKMYWLKKCLDQRNVFIEKMSQLKNVSIEEISRLKIKKMSLLKKYLDKRNVSIEEMSWPKTCFDWGSVSIEERCILMKCLY